LDCYRINLCEIILYVVEKKAAATYFSIFKAALKQAFIDGYLTVDLSAKIKGIQEQENSD
jgi:hypothetical protein